ncbi:MAG: S8 family serine peptidase [Acidobacteria bacterium]|nr:S8 family serine peptidase [Acidobacteriota bacterium]
MRKLLIISIALTLLLTSVLCRQPVSANPAAAARYLKAHGEVIVKFKERAIHAVALKQTGATLSVEPQWMDMAQAIAESAGTLSKENLRDAIQPLVPTFRDSKVAKLISQWGMDRTVVLQFDASEDLDAIIKHLRANEAVEFVEPNARIETGSLIPNDPDFSAQWGLRNLGLSVGGYPATLAADIHATDAWELTTGSPNVLIAVTDTGCDITHPDLAPNIYTNPREIPNNNIDDDNNGYVDDVNGYNVADRNNDISDVSGHGTEMSGIIAARQNNDTGISGVSQSKIIPVKFFRRIGPLPTDVEATVASAARALIYAIASGASIINASWSQTTLDDTESQTLKDAISATNEAGILMVCIAGNLPYNLDVRPVYPASFLLPNQIVVAASEFNDEIWHVPFDPLHYLAGYGIKTVDLAAPGTTIFTTRARGDCESCTRSTDPSQWYANIDGTSASAAYVTGVAALVKSQFPDANFITLKRRIVESVDVKDTLRNFVRTSGRLNAYNALTISLQTIPPVLRKLKFKASGKTLILGASLQVGATLFIGSKGIVVTRGTSEQLITNLSTSDFPVGVPTQVRLRNPDGGESQTLTITR